MDSINIIGVAALMFTVIGAVWTQGLWISRQFSVLKDFVNTKVDGVLDKLEYHERHDDQRFGSMRDDIWSLRVEHAQDKGSKGQISTFSQNQNRNIRRPEIPEGAL